MAANQWIDEIGAQEEEMATIKCFRCGERANQWFDGIGAQEAGTARAICAACEFADWKLAIRSLAAPQG